MIFNFGKMRAGRKTFGPGTLTPAAKTRQGVRGATRVLLTMHVTEKYPGMPRRDRRALARVLTQGAFQQAALDQLQQMVNQVSQATAPKLFLPRRKKERAALLYGPDGRAVA